MTRARFKQAEIERLLRAARRLGYADPAIEVRPDGSVVLLTAGPTRRVDETHANPWDIALGIAAADGVNPRFWEEREAAKTGARLGRGAGGNPRNSKAQR